MVSPCFQILKAFLLPFDVENGLGWREGLRSIHSTSTRYGIGKCRTIAVNVISVATRVSGPQEPVLVDHPVLTGFIELRQSHEVVSEFE